MGCLEETSLEELGGNATPCLPIVGTHLGTFQHLSLFHLADGQALALTHSWWQGSSVFYPHTTLQQTMVTKGNNGNITLFRITNTTDMMHNNRATHKVQLYTLHTLQQPSNTHQYLVRIGPDTLLTYFTVF